MILETLYYLGIAVAVHFVIEYFRRKPQIDNIASKSILVTGCDSGFGNKLAKRLDGLGCQVFAACYTQRGADELRRCSSSRLETVLLDVSKTDSIEKVHQFVVDKLGPNEGLWGLVNNAGMGGDIETPLEYMIRDDFQRLFDVNLLGLVDMTLHFLPLVAKSKGRIVNMASSAARVAMSLNIPYTIAKYGVEAFSDGLRPYMKRHGVHFSMLEPTLYATGIIDRNMIRGVIQRGFDRLSREDKDRVGHDYPDKAFEKFLKFSSESASPNLDEVVDAYQHALFAVNPKKRYTCGWPCRLVIIPLSYMPSWLQDKVTWAITKNFMYPDTLKLCGK